MNDFEKQIDAFINVVENVCNQVENNNYNLIPELINILEDILPSIFMLNNEKRAINNEEIIEILNDIVDAYENKDPVLMYDVLKNGLNSNLLKIIETSNNKEGN